MKSTPGPKVTVLEAWLLLIPSAILSIFVIHVTPAPGMQLLKWVCLPVFPGLCAICLLIIFRRRPRMVLAFFIAWALYLIVVLAIMVAL